MFNRLRNLALTLTLATIACDQPGSDPAAPSLDAIPLAASVRGAAQFTNDQGFYRRMEMAASKDASGQVSGTMQWVAGAAIIQGSVTCLTVQGNVAWVGGVVESAKFTSVPAGSEFYMAIVDNGEGQGAQDQTTARPFLKPAGSAQAFCDAAQPPAGLFSMDNGNIRVASY